MRLKPHLVCAAGGTDTIDVTAGFIKDISGNVATTDAKANAAITYSDDGSDGE